MRQDLTPGNIAGLVYPRFIAAMPIIGFWRMSRNLGLTPWLPLIYLFFSLITFGIDIVRIAVNEMLTDC